MTSSPLKQNATASTKAIVYQFCIAVQKCYEMTEGERVFIENYGDVSIENRLQIEVKAYSDSLSDSHKNLWKTLANWMSEGFNAAHFSALILLTTQPYGEKSRVQLINDLPAQQRFKILEEIYQENENRFTERASKQGTNIPVPDVLKYQRQLFETNNRERFIEIIQKLAIEANSPDLEALYNEIKSKHLKGILNSKRDDFLNALIGYVTKPNSDSEDNWVITYEEFDSKIADLTSLYCRETRIFPQKQFEDGNIPDSRQVAECQDYLFVRKIEEIDYKDVINKSIIDYLTTIRTINEELSSYSVPARRTKAYSAELLDLFNGNYRKALRNCTDIIQDSKNLFDEVTLAESHHFEGFEARPPRQFRNGMLHGLMNDDYDGLKWRLENDEQDN